MYTRMSNNMVAHNYITTLNSAYYRMVKKQEQLASESKLNRPSDSPVDTALDLRYKVSLTENEQYRKNLDSAISWMDTTHDCISDIDECLKQVRDLIVKTANDTLSDLDRDAVAEEIDAIIGRMTQIANTTLGDRYVFAGQNDRSQTPPFVLNSVTGQIEYSGDNNKMSMVINPGSVTPSQDSVNLTGVEVFGDANNTTRIFSDLTEIRDAIRNNAAPGGGDIASWLSNTALATVDADIDQVLTAQARLSAKVSLYNMTKDMLNSARVRINENISQVEDINVAEVAISFTVAESAYNAALSVGAKLLPMSLVDFLR